MLLTKLWTLSDFSIPPSFYSRIQSGCHMAFSVVSCLFSLPWSVTVSWSLFFMQCVLLNLFLIFKNWEIFYKIHVASISKKRNIGLSPPPSQPALTTRGNKCSELSSGCHPELRPVLHAWLPYSPPFPAVSPTLRPRTVAIRHCACAKYILGCESITREKTTDQRDCGF